MSANLYQTARRCKKTTIFMLAAMKRSIPSTSKFCFHKAQKTRRVPSGTYLQQRFGRSKKKTTDSLSYSSRASLLV
jgi:hypothetical protein